MKKPGLDYPILHTSVHQLLYLFLTEKYMAHPAMLGLRDFSIDEMASHGFEKTGDDAFCLFEKDFRLPGREAYARVKHYFHDGQFISNGIDLTHTRICTVLAALATRHQAAPIAAIELLLDASRTHGSLIVNGFIEVRFGLAGTHKRAKKFHLTGISTDYALPSDTTAGAISTRFARALLLPLSLPDTAKKSRNHPALAELADCLLEHFPHAAPGVTPPCGSNTPYRTRLAFPPAAGD